MCTDCPKYVLVFTSVCTGQESYGDGKADNRMAVQQVGSWSFLLGA